VLSYTDTLAQAVNVPASPSTGSGQAVTVTLTYWVYVQSSEPAGNGDDALVVKLAAPGGSAIGAPRTITSAAARNTWQKQTIVFNLAGYTYPTATLSFTGINDADNASSFFVDDVSLIRACPSQ
jgi:hypothetical protein